MKTTGKGGEKMKDRQIEEMIRAGLKKTEVPEELRKEKIIGMLKEQKDFSCETGNVIRMDAERDNASKNRTSVVALNRIATVAAAFVIVIACVVFATMNSGVRIIRTEPGFENYNSENLIIGISSYDEIENAVRNVLGKAENVTSVTNAPSGADNPSSGITQPQSGAVGVTGAYVLDNSAILDAAVSVYNAGGDIIENITGLEADIVKNNGEYIFVVTTGVDTATGNKVETVKVIRALPADEMTVASTVILSDTSDAKNIDECIEIYLKDNRLVAIMSRNAYVMEDKAAYEKDSTVALYYDITNPDSPVKIREHIQDGKYLTSGISENGSLYLVTDKSVSASEKDSIPSCSVNGVQIKPETEDILMAVNEPEAAFTFITVTDISDFSKAVDSLAFFGSNSGRLYVSGGSVLLSRGFVSVEADKKGVRKNLTEIYRFDIGDSSVSFAGSYAVSGSLSGTPSVDEKSGLLMAVATDSESTSLYVLDKNMKFVSGLEGIFAGEKIKDVKFYGEKCYVISDSKAETTIIIDLTDPEKPEKIATVSKGGLAGKVFGTGDEVLIHIGENAKDISISLLDLSDPLNPGSVDLYNLSGFSGRLSELDTKSIMLMPDKEILGIPVMRTDSATKSTVSSYALFGFSDGAIRPLGFFNHGSEKEDGTAVRGTCIGDIFYSISGNSVVAFSISGEERLSSVELK